jgi:hypothetical protein
MVRLVLALALAGCYAPDIADCADRCDTSNLCPDGLTCEAGYCRTEGATGACTASQQDMPDAATGSACPAVPMAQGCQLVGPQPVMPYCMAACAASTGTAALAFSVGTWHAAVLDAPEKLTAAMTAAGSAATWVGLVQPTGESSPSAGWMWSTGGTVGPLPWAAGQPDDGDHTENGAEQCATLAGSAFADEPCTASHPYLIQP